MNNNILCQLVFNFYIQYCVPPHTTIVSFVCQWLYLHRFCLLTEKSYIQLLINKSSHATNAKTDEWFKKKLSQSKRTVDILLAKINMSSRSNRQLVVAKQFNEWSFKNRALVRWGCLRATWRRMPLSRDEISLREWISRTSRDGLPIEAMVQRLVQWIEPMVKYFFRHFIEFIFLGLIEFWIRHINLDYLNIYNDIWLFINNKTKFNNV